MDSKTNTLRLDFRDNPELKTLLGGLAPGDRVTLELELMAKSVDDESFEAVVEGIAVEGEESEDESAEPVSGSVEPTADEPVMVVMATKAAKKAKSKEPYGEDGEEVAA
jgi:hypothetical protein